MIRFNDGSEKAFDIESIREMYPREKIAETNPKVRIAIYETIPGYSVGSIKFYTDATASISGINATIYVTDSEAGTVIDLGIINYTTAELHERYGSNFLGRASSAASFAGNAADNYYTVCLPNENGTAFTLRADYTLEAIDGSGETINVTDASVQIPAELTYWKPGYAYTYIFKICDNYDSWTGKSPAELYPIALDIFEFDSLGGQATR